MKKVITEEVLRGIIHDVIYEALSERGTNMDSLYHFTYIYSLPGIFRLNALEASDMQRDKRNGKSFISFTRHKSSREGFAAARECNVRIEVDGDGLSNIRNSTVYPYEYYSPNRIWNQRHYGDGRTAKSMYQDGKRRKLGGEFDYMHQAEESFEIDSYGIPIENITREIDILITDIELMGNTKEIRSLFSELLDIDSPLLNITYVYMSRRDFDLQTKNRMNIFDFYNKLVNSYPGAAE